MTFEPQKFFVGLVDFFSVLMPGGLLAYLGKDWAAQILLCQPSYKLEGAESWMVFLFASYLLGHFIFLIGSVLDDLIYDPFRKCTDRGQVGKLAKGERMSWRWLRKMATSRWFFKQSADAAVTQVERMKARTLGSSAQKAMNGFQWSKIWLSERHPEGLSAVQRFEADSKFFRSFVIVLPVLTGIFARQGRYDPALVCFILIVPAVWRYVEQRFKATQQAYWFILALESLKPSVAIAPASSPGGDEPTHAGGVVFRRDGQTVEYLLLEANKNRTEWVLPKGHIEPGEDTSETAVREVAEETGYWARVVRWIDNVEFESDGSTSVTRFYLMEFVAPMKTKLDKDTKTDVEVWPPEKRQHIWLTLDKAKEKAEFPETEQLLDKAEVALSQLLPN